MQAFIRYTKGLGNAALRTRIRSEIGGYWNFSTLIWEQFESIFTSQTLTEITDSDPFESTYIRTFEPPSLAVAPEGFVEIYVASGEVIAQESLNAIRAQDAAAKLSFDNSGNLLVDSNAAIVVPSMSGAVYSPTVVFGQKVTVIKNDTPTLTFNLANDYSSGWTVDLTMTLDAPLSSKTVIACTWLNAATGTVTVDLSSLHTSIAGHYDCSVKVRKSSKILTALRFSLAVVKDD